MMSLPCPKIYAMVREGGTKAGRYGHGGCCGILRAQPAPSELWCSTAASGGSILWSWLKFSFQIMVPKELPPYFHVRWNPYRWKKRQNSSVLIYGNTSRESRIWTNFLVSPDLERLPTKNKNELRQAAIMRLQDEIARWDHLRSISSRDPNLGISRDLYIHTTYILSK